jgi:hypothetical protein
MHFLTGVMSRVRTEVGGIGTRATGMGIGVGIVPFRSAVGHRATYGSVESFWS